MEQQVPIPLTFQELLKKDEAELPFHHTISIRGFLFRLHDKEILSSTPNVKSCCLGNPQKHKEQLFLKGAHTLVDTSYAVTIEGVLEKEQAEGNTVYFLEQPVLITSPSSLPLGMIAGGVVLILLVAIWFKRLKRRQS